MRRAQWTVSYIRLTTTEKDRIEASRSIFALFLRPLLPFHHSSPKYEVLLPWVKLPRDEPNA